MIGFKKTARVALLAGIGFTGASSATTYTWAQLPTLAGYQNSVATKLNDLGQVVGFSRSATMPNGDATIHATLWSNGSVTDLGTLGGAGTKSMAYGINNAGQIVGASNISTIDFQINNFQAIPRNTLILIAFNWRSWKFNI